MSLIGPEGRKQLKLAAGFLAVGFELAVAVGGGYYVGSLLDGKFGTAPYLGFTGLILGILAGARSLYVLAKTTKRQAESASPTDPSPPDSP